MTDEYDLSRLSDAELRQLERLLMKALRAPQATAKIINEVYPALAQIRASAGISKLPDLAAMARRASPATPQWFLGAIRG
jgi:hypothetical protein